MNKRDKIDNLLYELFEKENKKAPKDFSEFLKTKPYKKINQKKIRIL